MGVNEMEETMRTEIMELVERAKAAIVCSVDADGLPNAKAMLNLQRDCLKTFWFSTNVSARRTSQFKANPKACVYFVDQDSFKGLMLSGEMQVRTDRETRAMLWREGFEIYYPKGIEDEDYCVLKFEAKTANYYHALRNTTFEAEEF
jgi:general stress protein 26